MNVCGRGGMQLQAKQHAIRYNSVQTVHSVVHD